MTDIPEWVDGNDIAGAVGELFTVDLTVARGRCATCGREAMMAEAHVYNRAPGLVARCSGCESVLLRLVRSPDRAWLDVRGLAYLEFPIPATPEPASVAAATSVVR
jgi:xanthine/CO dehydrogenase XdhC/CoxF family maturation factor